METYLPLVSKSRGKYADTLLPFVCLIFFLCGFSSTLNTVVIPSLRTALHLSYYRATVIDLAFYLAYFTVSPIAGFMLCRSHSFSGIGLGVFCSVIGCFLIASAGQLSSFTLALMWIYLLGGGIALLQVEGNAYVLVSGRAHTASFRLAFAQFFTSIGQVLAPLAGARVLLHNIEQSATTQRLFIPYLGLFLMWGSVWLISKKLPI